MSDFLKCCRFVWTTCMGSCWPQSTMLTMAELLRVLHFFMLITAMLSLLCCFLRQGVLQELPVVLLVTVWEPMNWTWTDPFTIWPPPAGQRVTRADSNHPETPQSSLPIHKFLLQTINEISLTLQPVCNISIMLSPCYQQRDWSEMESCDVGIHIHVRFCK